MNSMEINKIAAAVLTAGVVAMLLGLVAKLIIPDPAAHGDGHSPNLFADLAPVEPSDTEQKPAGPEPIAAFLADASVEDGEQVAKKCTSCHTFEPGGANKVGPNLANLIGADKAHLDNFAYSAAFQDLGGTWSYEDLNEFLYKPRDYAPGTKMSFAGLKSPEDRAAVIAYMRSHTEDPPALPEPEEAKDEEEGEGKDEATENGAKAEDEVSNGEKDESADDGQKSGNEKSEEEKSGEEKSGDEKSGDEKSGNGSNSQ